MTLTTESKIIGAIGVLTAVILVIGIIFLSRTPSPNQPVQVSEDQANLLVRENSFQTAKDSGKLAVVEFADLECPACRSVAPIVEQVKSEYGDRINFVYRHFPLPQHKNAIKAAIAAEAAGNQGKFWEMANLLYERQPDWESQSSSDDPESKFVSYAEDLELDMDKFNTDYKAEINKDKIMSDQSDGNVLGVNSTPTFFINGTKYSVTSVDQFKQILDSELSSE